jgi:hypothetical protein
MLASSLFLHRLTWTVTQHPFSQYYVAVRGLQRDVVYLCWPIAPSYTSPNRGGCGVSVNEYSSAHHVTWSPNNLWKTTSIFSLWLLLLVEFIEDRIGENRRSLSWLWLSVHWWCLHDKQISLLVLLNVIESLFIRLFDISSKWRRFPGTIFKVVVGFLKATLNA